jgi:hypothetical protein
MCGPWTQAGRKQKEIGFTQRRGARNRVPLGATALTPWRLSVSASCRRVSRLRIQVHVFVLRHPLPAVAEGGVDGVVLQLYEQLVVQLLFWPLVLGLQVACYGRRCRFLAPVGLLLASAAWNWAVIAHAMMSI